jgi:uncharacterized LabA/DUF88 family protein
MLNPQPILKVAILVDGSYFLKRHRLCYKNAPGYNPLDPLKVTEDLYRMCKDHLGRDYLYRILFYDCPPFAARGHHPISKKSIDFSKTPEFAFRTQLLKELKKRRKTALRLGEIHSDWEWKLRHESLKDLIKGTRTVADLTEADVVLLMRQKGVDMKIGVDIAALAYKRLVDKIILVAGDSDFVPAAKIARREGIDFVLDPMWNRIHDTLFEHIDGLHSVCPRPVPTSAAPTAATPPAAAPASPTPVPPTN